MTSTEVLDLLLDIFRPFQAGDRRQAADAARRLLARTDLEAVERFKPGSLECRIFREVKQIAAMVQ